MSFDAPRPLLIVAAVCLLALGGAGAGLADRVWLPPTSPAADAVTIDATTIVRVLPPDFFGINYVGLWDSHQGSAASARALSQTPIRTVRFPGGVPGDYYDWRHPYDKHWSSTSPLDLWHYTQRLGRGGSVLFQTNAQGHTPSPHPGEDAVNSPAATAAWARAVRAQGIPATMEVGNEEDTTMHAARDAVFAPYVALFNAQARAIHAAAPGTRIVGPAGTNEYYWWALDSLGMFLQATGNRQGSGQVDGVSLHFYTGHDWHDTAGAAQYWQRAGGPWAHIQSTIASYDTRPLPVDISEWNLGGSLHDTYIPTLGHALVTADLLGAFAQSGVAREQYFDLHGGTGWGLLYGDNEPRPLDSPTPTYYAMALWGQMGRHMLPVQASDDPATTVSLYAARRADGSMTVLAINKLPAAHTLDLAFKGFDPTGRTLRLFDLHGRCGSLADLDAAYNGIVMPNPQQTLPPPHVLGRIATATVSLSIAPYSAVVLDMR